MSVYDGYAKRLDEDALLQQESIDKSTKAQLDALAENRKLVEAEKQNAYRGAYVDYAKNINPYGVQSELAYGSGLGGAGKGETAQANFYNSYQNRLGEINTTATGQLRDIAQQESAAKMSGEQAKLDVVSQTNQMKAAAQLEDARLQEQYAREDKANAYNQLLTAISSTGYTPTDAELDAAGMTRDMANSYKAAYNQQLAASYSSGGRVSYDDLSYSQQTDIDELLSDALVSGNWSEYVRYVNNLENLNNLDPAKIKYLQSQAPADAFVDFGGWDQKNWSAYFKGIYQEEGAESASALLQEYINKGIIPQEYVSKASIAANGMLK